MGCPISKYLYDWLHAWRGLRVGKLHAGDGEEDLADSDNNILGKQPEDMDWVGADKFFHGYGLKLEI